MSKPVKLSETQAEFIRRVARGKGATRVWADLPVYVRGMVTRGILSDTLGEPEPGPCGSTVRLHTVALTPLGESLARSLLLNSETIIAHTFPNRQEILQDDHEWANRAGYVLRPVPATGRHGRRPYPCATCTRRMQELNNG